MRLYLKILSFLKPYWKGLIVAVLLTFFYVLFNNLSIWISVDFVRELFDPRSEQIESVTADSLAADNQQKAASKQEQIKDVLGLDENLGIYDRINIAIKSVIIQDNRYDTLKMVCLIIFLSFLLKNLSHYLRKVILNYVEVRVIVNIRNQLHEKLLHAPLSYFHKKHSGNLTSIVFNDVNALNNVFDKTFGKMLLSPIQIIANIIIMLMISVKLSLITFIVLPLSAFIIFKIGQSMRRRSRRVFRQIADVVATFQEALSAINIVKIFTNERKEMQKFEATNYKFFQKLFRANKLKFATTPINEILMVFILIALLLYGGHLVYSNAGISAEDFIRFLVFLFTMFQPIKELSGINNVLQTGLAASERIFDVLETPSEVYEKPGAQILHPLRKEIIYKDVSFKYNEKDDFALKNVNFTIKRGEMVAFVGPSGSGKTTVVNLLPRFYDIQRGSITIDGMDIKDLNLHSLRKAISIVTQDTVLFNDTIRMNIAYGMPEIHEEDIIRAAQMANAWDFIQEMDEGMDTHIGERGLRLSGGQKQRLSIARAILKNPQILILDEATSALDTESERLVQDAINQLLKDRTVLVIAHRLSTIQNADKIVVLNKGHIEATGPHLELINNSALYKSLYENQLLSQPEESV
ncbi:MAG: ATP-binding cassette domain-containing protein [Caldithrix sp.]|nr:ATP-binding cassette domain-containing protein [Caldithrix sp.]